MAEIDIRSLAVCIQALQRAIRFHDFLNRAQAVDPDGQEDKSYMYEQELNRLVGIYKIEEQAGRALIALADLLYPPFRNLLEKPSGRPVN